MSRQRWKLTCRRCNREAGLGDDFCEKCRKLAAFEPNAVPELTVSEKLSDDTVFWAVIIASLTLALVGFWVVVGWPAVLATVVVVGYVVVQCPFLTVRR